MEAIAAGLEYVNESTLVPNVAGPDRDAVPETDRDVADTLAPVSSPVTCKLDAVTLLALRPAALTPEVADRVPETERAPSTDVAAFVAPS